MGVRVLIEAYGQISESIIAQTKRVLCMRSRRLVICLPYGIIGDVVRLLETYGTDTPTWKYGADAEVSAEIRFSAMSQVAVVLHELQARNLVFSWNWLLS